MTDADREAIAQEVQQVMGEGFADAAEKDFEEWMASLAIESQEIQWIQG